MDTHYRKTAFHSPDRSGETKHVDAPVFHLLPYASGGLRRLYHLIKTDTVPDLPEFGIHTNAEGHFAPQRSCIMGLRYKVKKILDSNGQSSVVVLVEDLFRGREDVVVKVLHTKYYALGFQESSVLQRLARADPLNHSQTLRLLATLTFDSHYCLVCEPLLPTPFTSVLKDRPQTQRLQDIRRVGLRLLCSLGFLHQQNLIHTDLKPDNILLKHAGDVDSVHIVDFGNALHCVHSEMSLYYQDFELQTPLYRAPEVMFGLPFGPEIDMWSLGCILAELYLGCPIFMGTSKHEILTQIVKLLGPLPTQIFRRGKYFATFEEFTADNNEQNATLQLQEHLNCGDISFANLIARLLAYRPEDRLSAAEASQHPFFASYLPLSFLSPQPGPRDQSRSNFVTDVYPYKPKVSPDIKRRQPTSLDLLRMGTSELSPLDQVDIIKPSPVRGKIPDQNHASGYSAFKEGSKTSNCDLSTLRNVSEGIEHGKFSDNIKDKMSKLLDEIKKEQNWAELDLDRKLSHGRVNTFPDLDSRIERPCAKYGTVAKQDRSFEVKGMCFTRSASDEKKLSWTENQHGRKMNTQEENLAAKVHRHRDSDGGIARKTAVQNENRIRRKRPAKDSIDKDDAEYIDLLSPTTVKHSRKLMSPDLGLIERKRPLFAGRSDTKNYPATTSGCKPRQWPHQEMITDCGGYGDNQYNPQGNRNCSSGFQSKRGSHEILGESEDNDAPKRRHHKHNIRTVSSGVFINWENGAVFEGSSQDVLPTPIKPDKSLRSYTLESPEIIYKMPLGDKKEVCLNQHDSVAKNVVPVDSVGVKSAMNRYSSDECSFSSDARHSQKIARRKSMKLSDGEDNTEIRSPSLTQQGQSRTQGLLFQNSQNMGSGIKRQNSNNSGTNCEPMNRDRFSFHGTPASDSKSLDTGIAQRIEQMRVKSKKEAKRSLSFQKTAKHVKDTGKFGGGPNEHRIESFNASDPGISGSDEEYGETSYYASDEDVPRHYQIQRHEHHPSAENRLKTLVRRVDAREGELEKRAKASRQKQQVQRNSQKSYGPSSSQEHFRLDKHINNTYVIDFESPQRS